MDTNTLLVIVVVLLVLGGGGYFYRRRAWDARAGTSPFRRVRGHSGRVVESTDASVDWPREW